MNDKDIKPHKQYIVLFVCLGVIYGVVCTALLFVYLQEVSKTVGSVLATSIFVIGGLAGLYSLLLSALSKVQGESEQIRTLHQLRMTQWVGGGIVAILVMLLIMNWILGFPFDAK